MTETRAFAMDEADLERPRPIREPGHEPAHRVRHLHARAAADRHSRRVRTFKVLIPALGLAALALVGGLTWLKLRLQVGIDVRTVQFSSEGLTMVEPRLSGRSEGRTYDVSAQRAFQNIQNPKIIRLESIDGRLEFPDQTSAKVVAGNGLYDGTHETLDLAEAIVVTTSQGWRADGNKAAIDLKSGRLFATNGVKIVGPTATITADTLELTENGKTAVFEGTVRMTLWPAQATPPADPASPSSPPPAR